MPSLTVQPVTMDRAPIYAVLFDGTLNPESYTPLVAAPYGPDAPFTIPHGLDHEVVAALPGLWYCLHLPNALFELIDIPPSGLVTMQSLDLGHHILLTPVAAFTAQYVGALLAQGVPVLAVCADELLAEATERCASLGFALQPAPYSQLCSESLKAHWRAIYELVETDEPYLDHPPYLSHDLKFAPADLPRRWLTRRARRWRGGSCRDVRAGPGHGDLPRTERPDASRGRCAARGGRRQRSRGRDACRGTRAAALPGVHRGPRRRCDVRQ